VTLARFVPVVLVAAVGMTVAPLPPVAASVGQARHRAVAVRHPRRTLHDRLASYAAGRDGSVSVAVYDAVADRLTRLHRQDRMVTASIVKVDILQTLLHRRDGRLSDSEHDLATRMIEVSDNTAASDLWNDVDGSTGVGKYDDRLGLTQTRPHTGQRWGLTRTSATDQIRLVQAVLQPSRLLSKSARRFARRLMRHVTSSQRWGISAGPTTQAVVGLKNGWLPVATDRDRWAVNSIGWVRGGGRTYQIAVLTAHQPSEAYGIATIEALSRLVWAHVDHGSHPAGSHRGGARGRTAR
jgi:beta-lactamase class A